MKFAINGLTLINKEVYGVHRYAFEIMLALDEMIEPNQAELIVPVECEKDFGFKNIKITKIGNKPTGNAIVNKLKKNKWNNNIFKKYVKDNGLISIDLTLNFPKFGCDIIAVHDCIPNLFPEFYRSLKDKLFRKMLLKSQKLAIKRCKYLVTVSESAKNDILKFYEIENSKIVIIPNAWQHFSRIKEDDSILNKFNLKDKGYYFSLGSRSPNKNIEWIMSAAKLNPNDIFVVSGSDSVFKSYNDVSKEELHNVIFTGFLSDGEIKSLMKHAKVFIQPSKYEGFGIPPMEAMSTGTKCIVSNVSSLPEIYGKSVWYIDPYKYESINLDEITKDKIEDNSVVLNKFSWKKSASDLLALISRINLD